MAMHIRELHYLRSSILDGEYKIDWMIGIVLITCVGMCLASFIAVSDEEASSDTWMLRIATLGGILFV